jgi:hypothetical protein
VTVVQPVALGSALMRGKRERRGVMYVRRCMVNSLCWKIFGIAVLMECVVGLDDV